MRRTISIVAKLLGCLILISLAVHLQILTILILVAIAVMAWRFLDRRGAGGPSKWFVLPLIWLVVGVCFPLAYIFDGDYVCKDPEMINRIKGRELKAILASNPQIRYWGDESRFNISYDESTGNKQTILVPKGSILNVLSTQNNQLANAVNCADWQDLLDKFQYLPVRFADGKSGLLLLSNENHDLLNFTVIKPNAQEKVWLYCFRHEDNYYYKDKVQIPLFPSDAINGRGYMEAELLNIDPSAQLANVNILTNGMGLATVPFSLIRGDNPIPSYSVKMSLGDKAGLYSYALLGNLLVTAVLFGFVYYQYYGPDISDDKPQRQAQERSSTPGRVMCTYCMGTGRASYARLRVDGKWKYVGYDGQGLVCLKCHGRGEFHL